MSLVVSIRRGFNPNSIIGCVRNIDALEVIKDVKALYLLYPVIAILCILLVRFRWMKG